MATYTKHVLSGSTNGRPIKINASTGTAGTALHTAATGTTNHDEVWLYGYNTASETRRVTVLFGGATDSDKIEYLLPTGDGMYTLIPGIPLNNTLVVRAYATTTGEGINVLGFVNRVAT